MRILAAAAFAAFAVVLLGGCTRPAGDEMIWWSDIEKREVGDPDKYVPGETVLDPVTGREIPKESLRSDEDGE